MTGIARQSCLAQGRARDNRSGSRNASRFPAMWHRWEESNLRSLVLETSSRPRAQRLGAVSPAVTACGPISCGSREVVHRPSGRAFARITARLVAGTGCREQAVALTRRFRHDLLNGLARCDRRRHPTVALVASGRSFHANACIPCDSPQRGRSPKAPASCREETPAMGSETARIGRASRKGAEPLPGGHAWHVPAFEPGSSTRRWRCRDRKPAHHFGRAFARKGAGLSRPRPGARDRAERYGLIPAGNSTELMGGAHHAACSGCGDGLPRRSMASS